MKLSREGDGLIKRSFVEAFVDELEKRAGLPSALREAMHKQQDAPGGRYGSTRSLANIVGKKVIPGTIAHEKDYPSKGKSAVPTMISSAKRFRQEGREALKDVPKQTIKKSLARRLEEGAVARGSKAGAALKERFGGRVESLLQKGRKKVESIPSPVRSLFGSAAKGLLRGLQGREKEAALLEGFIDELAKIAQMEDEPYVAKDPKTGEKITPIKSPKKQQKAARGGPDYIKSRFPMDPAEGQSIKSKISLRRKLRKPQW